jgi:TonB-linked SusC/RagA family outer membrane protein
VNTNFILDYSIMDGLKLVGQIGINSLLSDRTTKIKTWNAHGWDGNINFTGNRINSLTEEFDKTLYRNFTAYLEYDKTLAQEHQISFMAGASQEEQDYKYFSGRRREFPQQELLILDLGSSDEQYSGGYRTDWAIRSFFSRIGYNYKGKYLAEANFRYDASSRFYKDFRWQLFPSVLFAWNISEEGFMQDMNWLDFAKLRVSWGESGNQSGIGLYDYVQNIYIKPINYPMGPGQKSQGASLGNMVSKTRTWETVEVKNVGIEMRGLDNRLSFQFDYFIKKNKNMLIGVLLPSTLGSTPPFTNNGMLRTYGYETTLGWKDKKGDFEYSANVYLSDDKNDLVDLGGEDAASTGLVHARQGYPVNSYFGYKTLGWIQGQAELEEYKEIEGVHPQIGIGDAKYADINNDGKIDDEDIIYLGNSDPRYRFGLNLSAKWKNFDFSTFLQGVGQRYIIRTGQVSYPWRWPWYQPNKYFYGNTWTPENTDARFPRLTHGSVREWNYRPASHTRYNAAYVRIKNIQLGYTFSNSAFSQIGLSRARIYFSAENILTFDKMPKGLDPEAPQYYNYYPFSQVFSFGLDISL